MGGCDNLVVHHRNSAIFERAWDSLFCSKSSSSNVVLFAGYTTRCRNFQEFRSRKEGSIKAILNRKDLSIISRAKGFLLKFRCLGRFDNFDDQFDKNFLIFRGKCPGSPVPVKHHLREVRNRIAMDSAFFLRAAVMVSRQTDARDGLVQARCRPNITGSMCLTARYQGTPYFLSQPGRRRLISGLG